MASIKRTTIVQLVISVSSLAFAAPAIAQTPANGAEGVGQAERPIRSGADVGEKKDGADIIVTGSYLRRPVGDAPNPVSVLSAAEISQRGIVNIDQLLKTLPSNGVSRSTADAIGSPFISGTAQVNLRGFGLSSSLTLFNGRRSVVAPAPDSDGASFVDINVIPLIMVERLEVLQNGAAALYGSDAVAGVANFILRTRLRGIEARASVNATDRGDQRDTTLALAGGFGNDRLNFVIGGEYLNRTPLEFLDRPFTAGRTISASGQPGNFRRLTAPGVSLLDPNCAAAGGIAQITSPSNPAVGTCGINLRRYFQIITAERRLNAYATADYEISEAIRAYAEAGISDTRIKQNASPSYTLLNFPVVPATNPGNLVQNGGFGEPVFFFGRILGQSAPPGPNFAKLRSYRGVAGLKGNFGPGSTFDLSYTYSSQRSFFRSSGDVNVARFDAALNCRGGPNNDLCFNPFGSALLNPALANSQAVIDDFSRDPERNFASTLQSVDAVVTSSLFKLPGGDAAIAIGGQYRHETLRFFGDVEQATGQLAYFFVGPAFRATRNVVAGFAEIDLPVLPSVDVQLAGRYETYDKGIGGKFTPKAAARFEPFDSVTLRASIGKSFRAPSLSQLTSISTAQTALTDPLNRTPVPFFSNIVTVSSPDVRPEESTNYNIGVIFEPTSTLSFSADYFHYNYTDLIAKENAQAIVNANPLDPRIVRLGGNGNIRSVNVSFVNTRSVLADGIDFAANWATRFGNDNRFDLIARATWLSRYEANIGLGRSENLVGLRNYENFADPLPRWRANGTAAIQLGASRFAATINYIDSIRENLNNRASPTNGFKIGSFTTLDLLYTITVDKERFNFSVGVNNLLDDYPPPVVLSNVELVGFERQLHNPLGRVLTARVSAKF